MNIEEYRSYDGMGLAELVRNREVSPHELVEASMAVDEKYDPKLNYIAQSMSKSIDERMLELDRLDKSAKKTPLFGVPMNIKDLIAEVKGYPTSSGCGFMSQKKFDEDSEIIRQYRGAGLIFMNKTTVPQLGISQATESKYYGITRNPWDGTRTCGGSSGGSAVSVAVGSVPIAHANDGGGSIRIPASHCGIFGLKPSRGRTSVEPWLDTWQGWVIQHVLTRTVRDSAMMLNIEAQSSGKTLYACPPPVDYVKLLEKPLKKRLKIGYSTVPFFGGELDDAVANSFENALKKIDGLGHHLEPATPSFPPAEIMGKAVTAVLGAEMAAIKRRIEYQYHHTIIPAEVESTTWAMMTYGEQITAGEEQFYYQLAMSIREVMAEFHKSYDLLMSPVYPRLPPMIGSMTPSVMESMMTNWLLGPMNMGWALRNNPVVDYNMEKAIQQVGYTQPFNITGQPAISVPMERFTHIPVGIQFVAPFGREDILLQLAKEIEDAYPWVMFPEV